MLVIRLRRTGRTKKPNFRVVVAEKDMPIYGRFVDIIGNIDLLSNPKVININKDKALDWIKKGAQPSETVARLMVKAGILKKEDLNWKPDKKSKKKKDEGKVEEKPTVAPSDNEEKES
ncbi:MAG: 30S ribosomal protein S16, partial [Candidatus Woesearchaeota archaeon]